MSQLHKIEIADEQTKTFDSDRLIKAVEKILSDHQYVRSEVSIAIVDDVAIREINRQYLNHDYETDVISFVLDESKSPKTLTGQLVVSTDTADRLAQEVGATMDDELLLYVVHGMLHLVGFEDKDPELEPEMRAAEKSVLAHFGVAHRWQESESSSGGDSQ